MQHRQIAAEYKELRLLGRGAFAEVLLAKHGPTGQLYVLKRLAFKASSPEDDHDMQVTAMREVELLCALRHPHITLYRESFLDQNGERLNIVLEFCEKGTLAGFIANCKEAPTRRGVPEDRAWTWATQLLFAIQYCHSQNILHRDIKPANIFLTNKDQMKLGDFGIAKSMLGASATRTRGIAGTPFYLAPEICEDERHSAKSDMWALGVSLYELCCLRLPFHGSNILAVVRAITCNDPAPLGAPYSPKLSQMVLSMLEKDAVKRPTADHVIATYLRKEVVDRMEREVLKHDSLVPPGIPLQAPKPRRRPRGSISPPPPGVRLFVDNEAPSHPEPTSQTGVLDAHHPLISPRPGMSPVATLDVLPGAIAPEQTVGAALDSIQFLPFATTAASTDEQFGPPPPQLDSRELADIPFLGVAVGAEGRHEHIAPGPQTLRSQNDLTVVSVNSSMVSLEGYLDPPLLPTTHGPATPKGQQRRSIPSLTPARASSGKTNQVTRLPTATDPPSRDALYPRPLGASRHGPPESSSSSSAPPGRRDPTTATAVVGVGGCCCFAPPSDCSGFLGPAASPQEGFGSRTTSSGEFDQQFLLLRPTKLEPDGSSSIAPHKVIDAEDTVEPAQLSLAGGNPPGEIIPWEAQEARAAWSSPTHAIGRPADVDPSITGASKRTSAWAFTGHVEVVRGCRCVIL